ncbi:MAG: chemotaxis protein CheX [Cardiobacteriaceae bacterium]|nr:chemotaxis protein CheX [Cardiobacteriaceae bacterium]
MITEDNMLTFINGINRFFKEVNKVDIEVSTPYITSNREPVAYDYSGVITITGPYHGCIYFTAPQVLLRHVLISLNEPDTSEPMIRDIAGEIANTLSGNARAEYGEEFEISVPHVVEGLPDENILQRDARSFIIPMKWKSYKAALVICLTFNPNS